MSLLLRKLTYLQNLLLLVVYILPQEAGSQASRSREGCFNSTPDLGMARGTIPDSDITASSMINSDSHPHFARLGNSEAWTADRNDLTPWIQVNLQKAINVTAIATQGFSGSYVRQYYLSYSVSGNQWMNYTTQGVTKVFQANQNDMGVTTVVLNPLVVAQYIRLHPTNCSKFCALRMELYGCNSTAGFPGRPPAPTVSSTSATSISIRWNAPDEVGDGIRGYHVRWQEDGASSPEQKVVTSGRVTILDKLTPYTWYTIQVQPYNNKGVGLWSEELRVRSNESVPSFAPGNFKLGSSSSLSLDVSWDAIRAEQQQGKLLGYRIVYKKNGSEVNHTKDVWPNQYSLKIEKLEYASYAVKVAGYTRVGVGKFTEPKSRFPNEGVPSKPINIKAKLEDGSITVFWEKPADPNGIITRYEVYCKGTRSYNISFQTNNQISEPSTSRFARFSKAKLSPGTKFTIYVTAFTVKGEGDKSHHSVVETPSTAPPPPPPPRVDDDDVTATTITISLMLSPDINGKVIAHEVVVGKLEKVIKRSTKSLGHNLFGYEEAKENGDELYIAAKFDRGKITNQAEFVLGDGKTYGEYKNVPLEPKTNYIVYVRGITEDNGKWIYGDAAYTILPTTDSTESKTSATVPNKDAQQGEENDPKIAVVAACLGAVLFLALIGLAVVLVLRRKKRRGKDAEKPKTSCSKQSEPQYESVEPAAEAARLLEKHEVNITANSQKEQPKVQSEYAVVNKANKKPKKGDLVYAQLAKFDDTNNDVRAAEKPATYEPTVYAEVVASDVYHEASPDSSQPTYENVKNTGV